MERTLILLRATASGPRSSRRRARARALPRGARARARALGARSRRRPLPQGQDDVSRRRIAERIADEASAVLLGALGDPRVPGLEHARDILFGMRFGLDLYANIRPVKALADRLVPLKGRTREGRRLRRLPREHRGHLRRHRRPVQARHARRSRHQRGRQHAQGRRAAHRRRLRVRARRTARSVVTWRTSRTRCSTRTSSGTAASSRSRSDYPGHRGEAHVRRRARASTSCRTRRSSRSS